MRVLYQPAVELQSLQPCCHKPHPYKEFQGLPTLTATMLEGLVHHVNDNQPLLMPVFSAVKTSYMCTCGCMHGHGHCWESHTLHVSHDEHALG
jgi:hypothetical protein